MADVQLGEGKQAMGLSPILVDGKDVKRAKLAKEVNVTFGY